MIELAFVWYLRALAICFIGFTLQYWLRVSGYYPGENWRFDTMTIEWKIVCAMLSVLLPVSAVGLWSTLFWGQVVWTIAIVTELLMFGWFSSIYGVNPWLTTFHLASIIIYLTFRLVIRFKANKG